MCYLFFMSGDDVVLSFHEDYWRAEFQAMASPCQILIDTLDRKEAARLAFIAQAEALRIQNKFSRYRNDNIIHKINHSRGRAIQVDDESAALLDYAQQCYELSEGRFDITSGVLREAWTFDGSDRLPSQQQIDCLLPRIGWHKVHWSRPELHLPDGMQIDLGGIGKEYAVDRSLLLINAVSDTSVLVNFGGDLCTARARRNGQGWIVGVEDPADVIAQRGQARAQQEYELQRGGIATSGDTRRFLLKHGKRYSHILDPTTGWPVEDAPHSITTVASSCTEAGVMSTLAALQGSGAESFLQQQGVIFWVVR